MAVSMNTEPVAIVNAVRLVVLAAIAFGLHVSDVQLNATMAALEAVLTLFTRKHVYPSNSVRDVTVDAYLQGALDAVSPTPDDGETGPAEV